MLRADRHYVVTRRNLLRFAGLGAGLALPLAHPLGALAAGPFLTPTPTSVPSGPAATPTPAPTASATASAPPAAPTSSAASATASPTAAASAAVVAATPVANWVQALQPIPLYDAADDSANQIGTAARWDYFQILGQSGSRLRVTVARDGSTAYVDALSVGPSGAPPAGWPPPDSPPPPTDLSIGWLALTTDSPLWADPDGKLLLGMAPAYSVFKQLDPQTGSRLHVQDAYSDGDAYVDAANVGSIDPPQHIDAPGRWWGVVATNGANLRARPNAQDAAVVGQATKGNPMVVTAWVAGQEVVSDNPTWAQLGDGVYAYSSTLRPVALPAVPAPPAAAAGNTGQWIDINLTQQVVTAYEGSKVVHVARTSTGRPGWETAPGVYAIQRRVPNETMDSTSLVGLDASRASYKVDNVRWTQYFSDDGKALHENYWKPRDEFGIPSSHGCAGLVAEDAKFMWDWAAIGVPIYCHV
ncbi:MAG: L,D-transpeptidase [Chloroflexi bacterium]|nr:L,D-transpeptidase [Chloroflexota bacterium]